MVDCICFGSLRGDYNYLKTILEKITKVAKFDKKQHVWKWIVKNTTLICMGNFVDRYDSTTSSFSSYNNKIIKLKEAINDEINIIQAFIDLSEEAKKNPGLENEMVVLVGSHELGNIQYWLDYQEYQVPNSTMLLEEKLRHTFIENKLRPFLFAIIFAKEFNLI